MSSKDKDSKKKKIVLPPFGLAKEILDTVTTKRDKSPPKSPRKNEKRTTPKKIPSKSKTKSGNSQKTEESVSKLLTEIPSGPDRIYKFADKLRQETTETKPKKLEDQRETWVLFRMAREYFGFPVRSVQEILRVQTITRIPHAPTPIRGVTNMRGQVLPVVDLCKMLGLQFKDIDDQTRIIVIEAHERLIGLLVDSVFQVVHILTRKIQPLPADVMSEQAHYILGVYRHNGALILLLALEKILNLSNNIPTNEK